MFCPKDIQPYPPPSTDLLQHAEVSERLKGDVQLPELF